MNILNKVLFYYHRLLWCNNRYTSNFKDNGYLYFITQREDLINEKVSFGSKKYLTTLKPKKINMGFNVKFIENSIYIKRICCATSIIDCLYLAPYSTFDNKLIYVFRTKEKVSYYNPNYPTAEKWLLDDTDFILDKILFSDTIKKEKENIVKFFLKLHEENRSEEIFINEEINNEFHKKISQLNYCLGLSYYYDGYNY